MNTEIVKPSEIVFVTVFVTFVLILFLFISFILFVLLLLIACSNLCSSFYANLFICNIEWIFLLLSLWHYVCAFIWCSHFVCSVLFLLFFFFTSFYALFFHLHCQLLYVCVVMFCTMESFSFFSLFSFIHYDYMRLYIWLLEHIVVLDFLDVGNSRISYVTIEIVCFLVTLVCNKHTTSHVITIKLS